MPGKLDYPSLVIHLVGAFSDGSVKRNSKHRWLCVYDNDLKLLK